MSKKNKLIILLIIIILVSVIATLFLINQNSDQEDSLSHQQNSSNQNTDIDNNSDIFNSKTLLKKEDIGQSSIVVEDLSIPELTEKSEVVVPGVYKTNKQNHCEGNWEDVFICNEEYPAVKESYTSFIRSNPDLLFTYQVNTAYMANPEEAQNLLDDYLRRFDERYIPCSGGIIKSKDNMTVVTIQGLQTEPEVYETLEKMRQRLDMELILDCRENEKKNPANRFDR